MIPGTHHGSFAGANRLWFEDMVTAECSDGELDASEHGLRYRWAFRGDPQEGELNLFGPSGAVRAEWKDTWHARAGMALHGVWTDGVLVLYGTYPAGDGPEWGWRIELDTRDPQHFVMRMFNLQPGGPTVQAVDLRAARS